jgi:hypothetical protein
MDYTDAREMVNAILDYMTEHPERVLVSSDVPDDLLIGFTLRDLDPFLLNRPTWRIKTRDFSKTIYKFAPRVREILAKYSQTLRGRQLIAETLTKGRNRSEVGATPSRCTTSMVYENFFEMVDAILDYVKSHPGCIILSEDNPLARRVGFRTQPSTAWHVRARNFLGQWISFLTVKPSGVWEIGLTKLKSSVASRESVMFQEYLSTSSGRAKLASSLTAGINPLCHTNDMP